VKCKLLWDMGCRRSAAYPDGIMPAGSLIEHPDAWRLVNRGVAEPADEQCRRKITRSPEQIRQAQLAYPKVAAGIHPDDYALYDRGVMVGYDADGEFIPGPNYDQWAEQDEDEDD